MKDGQRAKHKLIVVYTLRDGKIAKTEELSQLLEGGEEHRDLGSRIARQDPGEP